MWIVWTIVIGFVAGVLAKFITPGDRHEPQGFDSHNSLGNRRRVRRHLPWPGSRLVSRRPEYRIHWRDLGRRSNSISVGLYRVEESNAVISAY